MFANIAIFYIIDKQNDLIKTKEKLFFTETHINSQIAHYEELYRHQNELRTFRHNIKNIFLSLMGILKDGDADKALHAMKSNFDMLDEMNKNIVNTGHPITDAILQSKLHNANSEGIKLNISTKLTEKILVDELELGIILGNALDNAIEATAKIENKSEKIDCYSFNITDGSLIYDGVSLEITANGKNGSMTLYADYQYVSIDRIQWSSSYNDKCYPDTFEYYLNNRSSQKAMVNYIKVYDGTEAYYLHYWNESKTENISDGLISVKAKDVGFGKCKLSAPVIFREHLLEFNITNGDRTYSLIYKFKPFIYDFDISVGWAGDDIEKESFIKAISSMHFNTVIGAYGSSYYLRDEAFRKQYPIKIFGYVESAPVSDKMTVENGVITFYDIDDIHAALPFGEPQLSDSEGKHQPMRVYNKLLMYRNSPYPTNITLTHEPAFYRFAGLSDFCHYDAYRVVAPFSDAWFKYTSYAPQKKYAINWGAPLETTGDYMRSLAAMNRPNPVAAWTQGANTWDTFPRFTKQVEYMDSPNPYELRVQAYLNVANGAASLYWFNVDGEDLLYYKESSLEMRDVNRELSVIGDYLVKQISYWYEREENIDLNVNIGSDYAVLFATDLNYKISDGQYKIYRYGGRINFEL